MKITKFKEDITSEIASSFKNSIAIDTEATGLQNSRTRQIKFNSNLWWKRKCLYNSTE